MDPAEADDDDIDQLMSMSTPTGDSPTVDGDLGDDLMFLVNYKLMDDDAAMARSRGRGGTPKGTGVAAAAAAAAAVAAAGAPSPGSAAGMMGVGGAGMSPGIPAGFTPSPGFMQMDLDNAMLASPLGTGAALAGVANAPLPPSVPGQQQFPGHAGQGRGGSGVSPTAAEQGGSGSKGGKGSEKDKRAKRCVRVCVVHASG